MRLLQTLSKAPIAMSWLLGMVSAATGLAFSIIAWYSELQSHILPVSWTSIILMHRDMLIIWIVDLAPLVMGVYGFFTGRTLEKLHSKLLAREYSENKLIALIDNLACGVVVINEKGHIQHINQAASKIFGYSTEELLNNNISVLMPKEIADQHDHFIAHYFKSKMPQILGLRREVEGIRKTGERFPLELKVSGLEFQEKQFFIGAVADLSEAKSLELQLYQARKLEAIGQLAAGIAHEINTPIQYIGDNLHALEENFTDLFALLMEYKQCLQNVAPECLEKMQAAEIQYSFDYIIADTPKAIMQSLDGTERVRHIVRAMKDFSYIDHSQITRVDINSAIRNTLTICHNEYKYIAEVVTQFGELPLIDCYQGDLNSVFLNLIVNAAHAIEAKSSDIGTITITTQAYGEYIEISIGDTGAGIPTAISERVFDPFFTTKEIGKGTGQGLHIAHQVISKHGGKIWFESEDGIGTIFYIQIPVKLQHIPN
ncbi:MAG: ATP-binding protein [Methylococcaceae bacterium]